MKPRSKVPLYFAFVLFVLYFWNGCTVVGGSLCNPICGSLGPVYWEKDCYGFRRTREFLTTYEVTCRGIAGSERKCYGRVQHNGEIVRMQCPPIIPPTRR